MGGPDLSPKYFPKGSPFIDHGCGEGLYISGDHLGYPVVEANLRGVHFTLYTWRLYSLERQCWSFWKHRLGIAFSVYPSSMWVEIRPWEALDWVNLL